MKAADLHKMDVESLKKELQSMYKAHFSLRMQLATQQISNSNQLKMVRRDIARIKTIMTQKTIEK